MKKREFLMTSAAIAAAPFFAQAIAPQRTAANAINKAVTLYGQTINYREAGSGNVIDISKIVTFYGKRILEIFFTQKYEQHTESY